MNADSDNEPEDYCEDSAESCGLGDEGEGSPSFARVRISWTDMGKSSHPALQEFIRRKNETLIPHAGPERRRNRSLPSSCTPACAGQPCPISRSKGRLDSASRRCGSRKHEGWIQPAAGVGVESTMEPIILYRILAPTLASHSPSAAFGPGLTSHRSPPTRVRPDRGIASMRLVA